MCFIVKQQTFGEEFDMWGSVPRLEGMIDEYTDRSHRKWEFEYVRDFDRHGNDYVEILAVWQVVGDTTFEVEFDIIDTDWIRGQEDRIECEAFGYQVHS